MKLRFPWGSRPAGSISRPPDSAPPKPNSAGAEPGIIGKLMIEAFGTSDPGCVRNNNEDYYLIAPTIGLYLVADGMGGAQAGEHASKLAAETVRDVIDKGHAKADADMLVGAFEEANRRVMDAAAHDPSMEGMGTTLVAALQKDDSLLI